MQNQLLFILLIFLFSCENKKKESRFSEKQIAALHLDSTTILKAETDSVIRVNLNPFLERQRFDFGSLVSKVKLIPLETTDESLVDDIYKVIATESNIYILDDLKGRGIAIFDQDGKFVKRIPNGQGPGELSRLYDLAYDDKNKELIAYQHSYLLFFTASGEFVRQERLPFNFFNFTVIPDGYVFKTIDRQGNVHLGGFEDYTLFITDKKFKLKSVGMHYPPIGKVLTEYNYLYNNNQAIMITQLYTDTVYQYISETGRFKAKYILDYSKKKLPERYLHCNSFDEFDKVIRGNDYYFYNGRYLETNIHQIFFLENYTIGRTVIYRNKQSENLIGGTNADFNVNEIPPIAFPIAAFENYFISAYFPHENDSLLANSSFISKEDKIKIKRLTTDDNPVLVFFQLKDF